MGSERRELVPCSYDSQVILVRLPPEMVSYLDGRSEGAQVGRVRFGCDGMEWQCDSDHDTGGNSSPTRLNCWRASQVTTVQDRIECYRRLDKKRYLEVGRVVRRYLSQPNGLDERCRNQVRRRTEIAKEQAKERKTQRLDPVLAPRPHYLVEEAVKKKSVDSLQVLSDSEVSDDEDMMPRVDRSHRQATIDSTQVLVHILGIGDTTVNELRSIFNSKELIALGCAFGPPAQTAAWQKVSSSSELMRKEVFACFASAKAAEQAIQRFETYSSNDVSSINMKDKAAQILPPVLADVYMKKGGYIELFSAAANTKVSIPVQTDDLVPKLLDSSSRRSRSSFRPSSASMLHSSQTPNKNICQGKQQKINKKAKTELSSSLTFASVLNDALRYFPDLDHIVTSLRLSQSADRLGYESENVLDTTAAIRIFHTWRRARHHLNAARLRLTSLIPMALSWPQIDARASQATEATGLPLWAPALAAYIQNILHTLDIELELLCNVLLTTIPADKRNEISFSYAPAPDDITDSVFPPGSFFFSDHEKEESR